MARNIIAMYPDLHIAERVVGDLLAAGADRSNISIVSHHATERYRELSTMSDEQRKENAARGAGAGALGGVLGGALLSIGLAAIPGVGWILAAGPVGSIIATGAIGAGLGAAAGGIGGALSKAGVPTDRAGRYAEGVRRGGALVAVEVPDPLANKIADVMSRHKPIDIDRSAKRWRDREGWEGYNPKEEPFDEAAIARERSHWDQEDELAKETTGAPQEQPVPEVGVGNRDVILGGARVHTYPVEVPEEQVDVRRQAVNRPADPGERKGAFHDRDIDVIGHGEEPVVNRTARGTEEGVVGKQDRHEVEIERLTRQSMERLEPHLREHARTRFQGRRFEDLRPAYHLGTSLAYGEQGGGGDFASVEPTARQRWNASNRSLQFDEVRDAVLYGYEEARGIRA